MTVVDASIVVRLLQGRDDDERLRARFARHRRLHAPPLIDAEVTSAVRGLLLTSTPEIHISDERAGQMLDDFADLPLLRYPMRPFGRRVLSLRDNFTAYVAFYLALAESLGTVLLTDDRKFEKVLGTTGLVETWT
ncbi:MAG: type II toxin-antitoxin system VapC family toxin [Phycicoccus sp.]